MASYSIPLLSADLHHKCASAVCHRAPIDLRVGAFTADVDEMGTYDVTCTRDGSAPTLVSLSQQLCSQPLTGATSRAGGELARVAVQTASDFTARRAHAA
eukprot:COSAG01_NODE_1190_length_11321_cov_15.842809_9_plen_100_part_00